MITDDVFQESGLFVPEQLGADARKFYFRELSNLGVTVDEIIERRLY
jgi:hypothetical protein